MFWSLKSSRDGFTAAESANRLFDAPSSLAFVEKYSCYFACWLLKYEEGGRSEGVLSLPDVLPVGGFWVMLEVGSAISV